MRKTASILCVIVFTTVTFAQKNVNFKAEISNRNGDVIYIKDQKKQTVQEIKINQKGNFEASFEAAEGLYQLFDGVENILLYLKNGYDLNLIMDAKKSDESIVFKGNGANENNFLAQQALLNKKFNFQELMESDEKGFNQRIIEFQKTLNDRIDTAKLETSFSANQKMMVEATVAMFKNYYEKNSANKKLDNTVSPLFDFENYAGGRTKLNDLKGKFVYIDIWATWCAPCRAEMPFLKKLEEKYSSKNIEFVSISIDEAKDYEKWKAVVKEKQLVGTQLIADKDWKSEFITAFGVNTIPRFILIDPTGKVVDANAMTPSDPKLVTKLDQLLN